MDYNTFGILVKDANSRSLDILGKKAQLYAQDSDRLQQFKDLSVILHMPPAKVAMGFVAKHFHALACICEHPSSYYCNQWEPILDDIRNYMYLIEGLLLDANNEGKSDDL